MHYGGRIKAEREWRGMTREQLAEASGLSASLIAEIEESELRHYTEGHLERFAIARGLGGMTHGALFDRHRAGLLEDARARGVKFSPIADQAFTAMGEMLWVEEMATKRGLEVDASAHELRNGFPAAYVATSIALWQQCVISQGRLAELLQLTEEQLDVFLEERGIEKPFPPFDEELAESVLSATDERETPIMPGSPIGPRPA